MTVGRGSKISDQIFSESKGIKARGIRSALLVANVKRMQERLLERISMQNMGPTEAIHQTWKKGGPLSALDFRLGQGRLRKPQ